MRHTQKPWEIPQHLLAFYLRTLAQKTKNPEKRMLMHTVISRVEQGVRV